MKKITAILVCLLLVASLSVTAFAADTVTMTVTPAKNSVNRNEVVDFTVTMSELAGCRSAGIFLEYDEAVLEFVTGSGACSLTGTAMANFGPIGGKLGGSFAFAAATDVSGQIFTFQMKVKDAAAFADTTITFTGNARTTAAVETTIAPVTMSVVCAHNWGDWTNVDETNHKHVCSVCEKEENAAHAWDEGKITTPATCKEEGVKTYACECGASKTEAIAKTENHTYGDWTNVDETNHKHVCSVCEKEETAAHAWDEGKITTPATCKEEGVKTFTCECGATKTEVIAKTENHEFTFTTIDGETHKALCSVCAKEETQAHDHSDKPLFDEESHWLACECGEKKAVAKHEFDKGTVWTEPTTEKEGLKIYVCEVCFYAKEEVLAKLPAEEKPTEPTEKPTEPTEKPEEPTQKPTEKPEEPTQKPTEKPAEPTQKPTEGEKEESATDKLGDNSIAMFVVLLMVLSAAGIALTVVGKKKFAR